MHLCSHSEVAAVTFSWFLRNETRTAATYLWKQDNQRWVLQLPQTYLHVILCATCLLLMVICWISQMNVLWPKTRTSLRCNKNTPSTQSSSYRWPNLPDLLSSCRATPGRASSFLTERKGFEEEVCYCWEMQNVAENTVCKISTCLPNICRNNSQKHVVTPLHTYYSYKRTKLSYKVQSYKYFLLS